MMRSRVAAASSVRYSGSKPIMSASVQPLRLATPEYRRRNAWTSNASVDFKGLNFSGTVLAALG